MLTSPNWPTKMNIKERERENEQNDDDLLKVIWVS